jgi:16S rRNA (cytosine967-C5)-methyltransferase
MREPARVQAAIELLDQIIRAARDNGPPADTLAARYFAERRYAGSKDRRAVRDLTWRAIRAFGECPENGRSAMAALADSDAELAALFDGSAHAPQVITPSERRASGGLIPGWLLPLFASPIDGDEQADLLDRAPVDLRVNTIKTSRESLLAEVPDALPLDSLSSAVRLPTSYPADQMPAIREGRAEVQDLGSQMIVQLCAVNSGMTVIDLCAGAGGKTLALAADMGNQGRLIASDTDKRRLGNLAPRCVVAGVTNVEQILLDPGKEMEKLQDFAGKCDVVLVDAPCSGSGTWRRSPETRWRLTPERLDRLAQTQKKLLELAAELVAPGGHLIYAVCSLLDREGRAQVDAFLAGHSNWKVAQIKDAPGIRHGAGLLLSPRSTGSDGFYMARLAKL